MTITGSERIHSETELRDMITEMEKISSVFYQLAIRVGNHAFIEFAGMMNEYIKICRDTVNSGRDFTCANTHVGQSLVFAGYNLDYIFEKMDCIFGPSISALMKSRFKVPLPASVEARRALRPAHYDAMTARQQWEIDNALGLLDEA